MFICINLTDNKKIGNPKKRAVALGTTAVNADNFL